jgi:hypothetical protein
MVHNIVKDEASYNPPPPESDWLKFPEGTTVIRILSHSDSFSSHYIKSENKTYDCFGDVSTCKYCQLGNKPRQRWSYLVLRREQPENKEKKISYIPPAVKVCEMGWSVFKDVLNLSKDPDYGDIRGYDLKISRTGTDKDTEYSTLPGKDTPLTDSEMSLLRPQNLDNIEKATERMMAFYKNKRGGEESDE